MLALEEHGQRLGHELAAAQAKLKALDIVHEHSHVISTPAKFHRLEDIPPGSTIWVTFTNGADHYIKMAINWAAFVRELGVPHLVVCFDAEAAAQCAEAGIPHLTRLVRVAAGGHDFRNDFHAFREMGSNKPALVRELLTQHRAASVVLSDTDTVWLRNPSPFLADHPEADVMVSTDCLSHAWEMREHDPAHPPPEQAHRCGHMPGNTYGRAFNTGVLVFRSRPATLEVLQEWQALLVDPERSRVGSKDLGVTDQLAFNIVVEKGIAPIRTLQEDGRTIIASEGRLKLLPLPVLLFNSGHVYFYQHLAAAAGVVPFVVHATFQRHHTAGKVARLREADLWTLDGEDYHTQGNFLTYRNDVATFVTALEAAATAPLPDLFKHLLAMSFQLAVLQEAAALAVALGRSLVLPRWVCWCDQDWYASVLEGCRVASSDLSLPFGCPTDMLLNPGALDAHLPGYRLAAFLDSPRTPAALKHSREIVTVLEDPAAVTDRNAYGVGAGVALLAGATQLEVQAALQPVASARVLHVHQLVPHTFGGFTAEADRSRFNSDMRAIFQSAAWCCSGEQPIEVDKITWPYVLPLALEHGAGAGPRNGPWPIPQYVRPAFCDALEPALNREFTLLPNHPCNFLGAGIQLPHSLRDLQLYSKLEIH